MESSFWKTEKVIKQSYPLFLMISKESVPSGASIENHFEFHPTRERLEEFGGSSDRKYNPLQIKKRWS